MSASLTEGLWSADSDEQPALEDNFDLYSFPLARGSRPHLEREEFVTLVSEAARARAGLVRHYGPLSAAQANAAHEKETANQQLANVEKRLIMVEGDLRKLDEEYVRLETNGFVSRSDVSRFIWGRIAIDHVRQAAGLSATVLVEAGITAAFVRALSQRVSLPLGMWLAVAIVTCVAPALLSVLIGGSVVDAGALHGNIWTVPASKKHQRITALLLETLLVAWAVSRGAAIGGWIGIGATILALLNEVVIAIAYALHWNPLKRHYSRVRRTQSQLSQVRAKLLMERDAAALAQSLASSVVQAVEAKVSSREEAAIKWAETLAGSLA